MNSHVAYNKAVSQVIREELLLNIVRRRYVEAPQFVNVASISTSIGLSVDAGASATMDNSATNSESSVGVGQLSRSRSSVGNGLNVANVGVSGGVTFSDSPTITLTPLSGEEIMGALTKRMSHVSVAKLANAGYPFDLLVAVMVENLTNVRGPRTGPGREFRPGSPEYVELIDRLGSLIEKNQLLVGTWLWEDPYSDITYTADQITPENQVAVIALGDGKGRYRTFDGGKTYHFTDKQMYPGMWIAEEARTEGDGKRVIELLNLQPDPMKRIWTFDQNRVIYGSDLNWETDAPRTYLRMQPRSFYAVMDFLAYGVRVPPKEEQEGIAFPKTNYDEAVQSGLAVDLTDKFVVHWSKEHPSTAFVTVRHRDKWFYIDDSDYVSKRFFNAVYDLFNLEVVPTAASSGPVLTLPVN